MNGNKIIAQVISLYGECESYSEFGSILNERTKSLISFRTFFERPNNFYFEVEEAGTQGPYSHTVWTNGLKVISSQCSNSIKSKTLSDINLGQVFYEASRRMELLCLSPTLLLPELKNLSFGFFDNLFEMETEDEAFYELVSVSRPHEIFRVKIRKVDYALFMIQRRSASSQRLVTTSLSEVVFNADIQHVFNF